MTETHLVKVHVHDGCILVVVIFDITYASKRMIPAMVNTLRLDNFTGQCAQWPAAC